MLEVLDTVIIVIIFITVSSQGWRGLPITTIFSLGAFLHVEAPSEWVVVVVFFTSQPFFVALVSMGFVFPKPRGSKRPRSTPALVMYSTTASARA